MASKVDSSLNSFSNKKFGFKKPQGGGQPFRKSFSGDGKSVSDLRSVLAKKQAASINDLREKLKPKALYTSKLASRNPQQQPPAAGAVNGSSAKSPAGRKQLKLTPSFKNSVSSAVSGSSSAPAKPSRSRVSSASSRPRSSSYKLPSYEEAKKISVTVPGLSRPVTEYSGSHRREERLAAQIARSKESRQDTYMRGREEFLASAITSAGGSFGGSGGHGGGASHGGSGHGSGDRDRSSMGIFAGRMPRGYPARSPSPEPYPEYSGGSSSFDPLYSSLGGFHHKAAAPPLPPAPSYSSSGRGSQRGITTATSMIISNLSDTVSKNDVAELCSVVGSLDGVYMHAPGIAEVVFKYKDDALEAFKKYNQRNLDGQPMHCKLQPASRSRLSAGYGHSYADDYYPHHAGIY